MRQLVIVAMAFMPSFGLLGSARRRSTGGGAPATYRMMWGADQITWSVDLITWP